MANVLAELFGDIADAIRTKTGGTDKMSPAAFPEKISAIEAGGGSSLPAGIYWQQDDVKMPNAYRKMLFMFDGALYAWTLTAIGTTASSTINVYKYVNGSWTQKVTAYDLGRYGYTPKGVVEFNGKAHVIGDSAKNHFTYDDTNGVIAKNNLPNNATSNSTFVQDGKLKYYSYSDGNVYVWDEDTDSWTVEALVGSKYAEYRFYMVGESVYAENQKKMYRYENGALVNVGTSLFYIDKGCVVGKRIYYLEGKTAGGVLYAYDTDTGENFVVGNTPGIASWHFIINTFDQIRLYGSDYDNQSSARYSLVMYEVKKDAANG